MDTMITKNPVTGVTLNSNLILSYVGRLMGEMGEINKHHPVRNLMHLGPRLVFFLGGSYKILPSLLKNS